MNTEKKWYKNPIKVFLAVIGLVTVLSLLGNLGGESTTESKAEGTDPAKATEIPLSERIQKNIDSFSNIDEYQTKETVIDVQMQLVLFSAWAEMVVSGKESPDEKAKELAIELEKKASDLQKKFFPLLRKDYAAIMDKTLWENDIDVEVSKTGNNRVTFTGAIFAANKNKKEFLDQVEADLVSLRFKEVKFKWFEMDDDTEYFTFDTPSDQAVAP